MNTAPQNLQQMVSAGQETILMAVFSRLSCFCIDLTFIHEREPLLKSVQAVEALMRPLKDANYLPEKWPTEANNLCLPKAQSGKTVWL